jgi:hypothetical protein
LSNKIEVLYKYRLVDDNSVDALSKGVLWYSKPAGLNDPHDVAPRWKKELTDTEVLEDFVLKRSNSDNAEAKAAGEAIAKFVAKLRSKGWNDSRVLRKVDATFMPQDGKPQRELLQDTLYYNETIFASMGVLSLSEDPKHAVMWGSYSNSHRGFCLGFEYHETNVLGQYAEPIRYLDKMPKPSVKLFSHDAGEEAIDHIALTKSKAWEYEQEWRVLKPGGNKLFPYPGKLVEVILGMHISDEDETRVRNAIRESGYSPNYYKLKSLEDDYGYELVPQS